VGGVCTSVTAMLQCDGHHSRIKVFEQKPLAKPAVRSKLYDSVQSRIGQCVKGDASAAQIQTASQSARSRKFDSAKLNSSMHRSVYVTQPQERVFNSMPGNLPGMGTGMGTTHGTAIGMALAATGADMRPSTSAPAYKTMGKTKGVCAGTGGNEGVTFTPYKSGDGTSSPTLTRTSYKSAMGQS
jgi:hypothetical protein